MLTLYVVIGTANHFILDAVGGALVLGIALAVERLLSGRHAYGRATLPTQLSPEPELAAA
jgi:hypothetical protein